ncbi:MAG: methionine--tRNA ligase [Clostridiales bacterium]|jgi:methionyl-tRNA synthetase|nr:methionine--tRNA ligase [Clostridiales bacterium]
MKDTFYITTPIYYPSDKLHIGNTYCTVAVDVMARYKRLRGYDVKFLTGTDDHGQKIERVAEAAGVTPIEYVDRIVDMTKKLWKTMNCAYDVFMRTTEPFHIKACQRLFKTLFDKGDIYKGHYEGLYCVQCETFFTKTQAPDNLCADCGRPLETVREESYFFRQSKYQDQLLKHIEDNPDFIRPESRKNEMVSFIKSGLEDVAVSRTTFKWGIPVGFDEGHVIYVWFDALPNYVTALGLFGEDDSEYKKYWPADVHMVGKDILRFHTILWPTMLMALGEPLPKTVFGTGWLLIDGAKMSKSKGNVVDPEILVEKYGVDAVRYFLMREVVMGQDGNYTEEALASRINADLANDLGNLLSRAAGMIDKYFGGTLPAEHKATSFDESLINTAGQTIVKSAAAMDRIAFSEALTEIWTMVRRANKYVDETEPWTLFRNGDKTALAGALYNLAEILRLSAILISPVMPDTSAEIFRQLGITDDSLKTWNSLSFGGLPKSITIVKGAAMFPRIDLKAAFGEPDKPAEPNADVKTEAKAAPAVKTENYIGIEDFAKLELRVGIVKSCEKVSEKLLKSQIEIGGETRQILSGIAERFTPEDMIGKAVVVVTNLKPIKLRGHMSEGMILAAGEGEGLRLVTADGADSGAKVK